MDFPEYKEWAKSIGAKWAFFSNEEDYLLYQRIYNLEWRDGHRLPRQPMDYLLSIRFRDKGLVSVVWRILKKFNCRWFKTISWRLDPEKM